MHQIPFLQLAGKLTALPKLYLRCPLLREGRGKKRIGTRKMEWGGKGTERNGREGENDLTHPLS